MSRWIHPLFRGARSPWFWLILGGYTLRLLVMPLTSQHDALFMPWMTHYLALGQWNLYAYLYETFGPGVVQGPFVWAPYPYGFYLYTAGWLKLLDGLHLIQIADWDAVWGVAHVSRYLFLAKLAYLPFDLLIAFILYRVGGKSALALWAWSPLAFYTPFMMGQNDAYVTGLAVLGTYAAAQAVRDPQRASRWMALAALALGLGSTFKLYPVFLLPPLIVWAEQRWFRRAGWLALGMLPLVLVLVPFVSTPAFQQGVLFNPEGVRVFDLILVGSTSVSPFWVSYFLVLAYLLLRPASPQPEQAWGLSALVLGLLFLWVNTAFYWGLWLMPHLILLAVRKPGLLWAWGGWQIAWAARLPLLHPDFGVGLLKNIVPACNPVNLPTALLLTHPTLHALLTKLWIPLVNSLWLASLLVILGGAAWALHGGLPAAGTRGLGRRPGWLFLPVLILVGLLGVNLWLARSLGQVLFSVQYWDRLTLQGGQTLTQLVPLEGATQVTGLRLHILQPADAMELEFCLLPAPEGAPLACARQLSANRVDGVNVYALFEQPVRLSRASQVYVRLRLLGEGRLTLRFAPGKALEAQVDGAALDGAAALIPLAPLQRELIFEQWRLALRDPILITLQGLTWLGLAAYFSALWRDDAPPEM